MIAALCAIGSRNLTKLSRREIHLIGLTGLPYYAVSALYIFMLAEFSAWFWLLVIPAFALYDRTSQLSYFKWVRSERVSKLRYVAGSLAVQAIFLSTIFAVTHGVRHVAST